MRNEFTGKHMAMVLVGGFGIVMAVNFSMAAVATSGFGGVVVENSYIASQKFNGWLEEAERQEGLGWQAATKRTEDGWLEVETEGVPAGAVVNAKLRRPLGQAEYRELSLLRNAPNLYRSPNPLPAGRWLVRLTIESGGRQWKSESELR